MDGNPWSPVYTLLKGIGPTKGLENWRSCRQISSATRTLLPVESDALAAWRAWTREVRLTLHEIGEPAPQPEVGGGALDGEQTNEELLSKEEPEIKAHPNSNTRITPAEKARRKLASGLSEDTASRLRYVPELINLFSKLPYVNQVVWSAYWGILNAADRRLLWNQLSPTGIFKVHDGPQLMRLLKELAEISKKYGYLFSDRWEMFVDLHLLQDYLPSADISDFADDVKKWVTHEYKHTLQGSEERFYQEYAQGIDVFLSRQIRPFTKPVLTPEQWISDPMRWAKPGSSDGKRLKVVLPDGRILKSRKSKWATACAITYEEALAMFYSNTKQTNGAIQKRELGKVRAVLMGDFNNYLRMSYVSYWMESVLMHHPNTSLWYSGEELVALWERMEHQTLNDSVKCPIDESKNDHHISSRMIAVILERIEHFVDTYAPKGMKFGLMSAMRLIRYSLDGGTVTVGKQTIPVQNGLLSGWRWTAVMNTFSMGGKVEMYRKYIQAKVGYDPVVSYTVQGDDVQCVCPNYSSAIAMVAAYDETGFDVNPGKTFVDTKRDEYLRQVARPGLVTGYPARAIPSLVFRNPVTRELARGEERIKEMVTTWNTIAARLGYMPRRQMIKDIAQSNKLPHEVVENILGTPAAVGGVGLDLPVQRPTAISKGRVRQEWRPFKAPPLALHLGKKFGVDPSLLSKTWLESVDGPPQAKVEFEPFELKYVHWPKQKHALDTLNLRGYGRPLAPFANQDLPPSIADAYIKMATTAHGSDILKYSLLWADPSLHPFVREMWRKCSRRTFIDWINGSLPFSVPVVECWGAPTVSLVYNSFASQTWLWATRFSKITYERIVDASYTAECLTKGLLARNAVRIGA